MRNATKTLIAWWVCFFFSIFFVVCRKELPCLHYDDWMHSHPVNDVLGEAIATAAAPIFLPCGFCLFIPWTWTALHTLYAIDANNTHSKWYKHRTNDVIMVYSAANVVVKSLPVWFKHLFFIAVSFALYFCCCWLLLLAAACCCWCCFFPSFSCF